MLGGIWKKHKFPIAVDVSNRSVRLLQAELNHNRLSVASASEASLSCAEHREDDRYEKILCEGISQAISAGSFVGNHAVLCLPAARVSVKHMRLPQMPADELPMAVKWEASQRFGYTEDSHVLQFYGAGEVLQGDEVREEIIIFSVKKAQVDQYINVFDELNMVLGGIEVDAASLLRWAAYRGKPNAKSAEIEVDAEVIIDVGQYQTSVLIHRHGRVVFYKVIEINGHRFDRELSDHLNIPVNEAHDLRMRHCDAGDEFGADRILKEKAQETLRNIAAELAREIGLCLRYFSVTFRGKRPEVVTLIGSEISQKWLTEIIENQCGVSIHTENALDVLDSKAEAEKLLLLDSNMAWATSIGLSLRNGVSLQKGAA